MAKDSKEVFQQKAWLAISNFLKEPSSQDPHQPVNYWLSQNVDVRTDPFAITLNNATQKESGNIVTDLLKWADITPASLVTYAYGSSGNIYSRTAAGSWSFLHQATSSHGNGLQYFYGDDYVYYAGDKAIGRYGPLSSSPSFTDDFLTAQGGTPQNTYALSLVSSSSQSADAADSASLSVTGDITLEAYFYLNSLPAVGSSMTLIGKWDESGALRSYIMDIFGVSGFFGNGTDGALTISSNTTESPIDSACSGSAGNYLLSATNASFAIGQVIWIHQTQGTNAGQNERNIISGYSAGTITLQSPLIGTYTTGAQVRTLPQYTNVTINSGVTYTAKAWNGTTGGILAFLANGTTTITGTISASGSNGTASTTTGATGGGFRGGNGSVSNSGALSAYQGEGNSDVSAINTTADGNGGGGAFRATGNNNGAGGGGGGNGVSGTVGSAESGCIGGALGSTAGSNDLTTIVFGGGGGGLIGQADHPYAGAASGGGIVFISSVTLNVTGGIHADGGNVPSAEYTGGAGGGGSILLKAQTATLGTGLITASGGKQAASVGYGVGGKGGDGRIALDYYTSYTGSTTPTLNPTQDNTLVTTATYQGRIGISNDGTSAEYLTCNIPSLGTGQWNRLSISWAHASSQASFYLNGASIGTATGSKTAISDNASLLYIGANKGASAVQNYLNGYIDDVRIWGTVRSSSDIYSYTNKQLTGNEGSLEAYYKFNNAATDSTTNANHLTLRNTPSYVTSVPFVDPTTRLDIDQSFTTTGSTYAVPTAISEATADQLPFSPLYDPQKSMDINVSSKGTGDWTLTIHDQENNVVASKTITNANMISSGYQEFVWTSPWRIVIGKSYHAHITVSTGTSAIVSSSLNTLQSAGSATGNFHTYYQFLVTDTFSHPIARMLNFLVIGNERYIAKWDGAFYSPNLIAFPAGTHVRCMGFWGKYIAFGTWQEASSGTPSIYDFPTGKIYFWDGISLTFNFSVEVPEGQVNAMFGMDSDLYYFAGYKGDLMAYREGFFSESGNQRGMKIKRIPYLKRADYLEVYPQAMNMWHGLLTFGLGASTNSTSLNQGVYSWGTLYPDYPESLSQDYTISTGNSGTSVKIGLVYPVQQKLLIAWQDGISFGVDVVDPTSGVYYQSGYIQTNLQDGGYVYENDLLLKVRADHLALSGNEEVQVGFSLDRGSFDLTNSITDTGNKFTTNELSNGRVTEYQLEAMLRGDGTSSPTLLSLAALTDSLESEAQQI